jgi:hypothetical protein
MAKLKFTARSINSIETKMIIIFFLVIKIPKIPRKNMIKEKNNKKNILKLDILSRKNIFKAIGL